MRSYTVHRSVEISAPIDHVRALVEDLRQWVHWSPWDDLAHRTRREYSGPTSGEGAYLEWAGDGPVRAGNMMIAASAHALIDVRIVLLDPWHTNNPTRFEFTATSLGTRVTWSTHGRAPRRLFGNPRAARVLADDFARGLERLKTAAESIVGVGSPGGIANPGTTAP